MMFGAYEPEIQTNISIGAFDKFDAVVQISVASQAPLPT
jgi:hypothetical protein